MNDCKLSLMLTPFTSTDNQMLEVQAALDKFKALLQQIKSEDTALAYGGSAWLFGGLVSKTITWMSAGYMGWHGQARYCLTPLYQEQLSLCLQYYCWIKKSCMSHELQRNILETIAPYIRPNDLPTLIDSKSETETPLHQVINYFWGSPESRYQSGIKPLSERKMSELIEFLLYGNYQLNVTEIIQMGQSLRRA